VLIWIRHYTGNVSCPRQTYQTGTATCGS